MGKADLGRFFLPYCYLGCKAANFYYKNLYYLSNLLFFWFKAFLASLNFIIFLVVA
jgi:hypothetical protein